jgi:hypothetical protein
VKVTEIHRIRRLHEDERARMHEFFLRARIVGGVGRNLREGDMARGRHEGLELGDGHRGAIHPEPVDAHAVDRPLLGIVIV